MTKATSWYRIFNERKIEQKIKKLETALTLLDQIDDLIEFNMIYLAKIKLDKAKEIYHGRS